ncbi:hypothetical protein KR074_011578 [Drosophila pseudoananassae]|nr:hypothetical protein KR074_011578 [Drosophila pseudoananassae]
MAFVMNPFKMTMVSTRYRNIGLLIAATLGLFLIWMFTGRWGGRKGDGSPDIKTENLDDTVPTQEGQAQFLFSQIYYFFLEGETSQPEPEEGKFGPLRKILNFFKY